MPFEFCAPPGCLCPRRIPMHLSKKLISILIVMTALICTYWVLIGGLNLVVGYSGQLSIGHVGLLAIGAYCFAILAGTHGLHPGIAIAASGALCAMCGLLLGLPSLRLPGFYFAMATLAFSLIVTEITLAQGNLTGGGVGLS